MSKTVEDCPLKRVSSRKWSKLHNLIQVKSFVRVSDRSDSFEVNEIILWLIVAFVATHCDFSDHILLLSKEKRKKKKGKILLLSSL